MRSAVVSRLYLQAVITGTDESLKEFEYTPEVGERLKAIAGQKTVDLMSAAGVSFNAGREDGKASTYPRVV